MSLVEGKSSRYREGSHVASVPRRTACNQGKELTHKRKCARRKAKGLRPLPLFVSFVSHHLGILLIAHVVAVFVFDSLCQESECGHVKRLAIWASHLFHHRITHNIWLMHTNHTVQNSQRGITSSNFEVIWRSPSLKHNTFASAAYARQTNTGKSRNVMRPAARRLSRRPDRTNISKPL